MYIKNKAGFYLDLQGDNAVNHANIQIYHFVNNNSQRWKLVHVHTLAKTDAKPATANSDGNYEYWTCSECGKCFSDSAGKTEISKADTVIPKKKPVATATPKVHLSKNAYTWNNKVQTPKITVKAGSKTLPSSCYKVTYPKGRKNIGTYTIKVTLKNGYSGTRTASYTIVPKGTKLTGASVQKKAVTIRWARQTSKMPKNRIGGYQIQYSLRKDFKSGSKIVTVGGYSKTSRKISGLASKKTYYFRVRTYMKVGKKNYYSGWSKARAVKVK